MAANDDVFIRACSVAELEAKQSHVIRAANRPVVVFYNAGKPAAVDNRCPHMGFPLAKGSCKDGMITCHWHHARFDAASGCTYDFFAGDVEPYDVEIRDGDVYVAAHPRQRDRAAHAQRQLREGMERSSSLNIAKAILSLRSAGTSPDQIIREALRFGTQFRDSFSSGMVLLTAAANVLRHLDEETAYLALFKGISQIASDCSGQTPRRRRYPLETADTSTDELGRLLRYWTITRHRDGAERTLLTAAQNHREPRTLSNLLFAAASERFYADNGHLLDFANKAAEALDLIGWDHAQEVLPALMSPLTSSRGEEEFNAWRHPIDLVPLVRETSDRLPHLGAAQRAAHLTVWNDEATLTEELLRDDPGAILTAITTAIESGATGDQLGKCLALAAAVRVARFATSNEHGDWLTALHTFTYCNAVHQALLRTDDPLVLRAVLHGAMSVYQDRFLNVPPAKLPGERGSLDDLPRDPRELLNAFLETLDTQQQVEPAAKLVARYLELDHDPQPLLNTLAFAVVREDVDFHAMQMVEAAIRQYHAWNGSPQAKIFLIAAARYLAAHSPTQRAALQTARIALRLHRGEKLYEEDEA
jgi:nitrite reductase/ring-hydroxylating ferredoxin subunit